jgi:thiamine transport system permease protein
MRQTGGAGVGSWRWGIPALLLLLPFLAWPLGAIVARGVAPGGVPSLEAASRVLSDGFYWERLAFTTAQALASTALAVLAGLPAAYVFALIRFPGRRLARALITVPFVLPTIVVALAFQQLLGPSGWVNEALGWIGAGPVRPVGTIWAILAAHVFYNVSVVVRLVSGVWANLDRQQDEAARILGAGRLRAFTQVTLPALLPAIASAAALVFTFTFTSFGVVLILGGPGLDTLEVTIYRLATRLVQLPEASILALVQLAATLTALVLYSSLQRRAALAVRLRGDQSRPLRATSWGERGLLLYVAAVLGLLILAPMAALVHGAFTRAGGGAFTTASFTSLFEDTGRVSYIAPLDAIRWSLTFAAGATLAALLVGTAAGMAVSRGRGWLSSMADGLLMLPLAVPAIVLGFGFLITFNAGWYDLRGSPWLVLVAHSLIAYPFVVRAVLAVTRSVSPHLPEAASVLGASGPRLWRYITLPIASRAMLVGAVFAFAISLGEFGATLLLRRRDFATLPIAIFESLARPGVENLGRALALATILMAVTVVAFMLIERFRYREVGEF